MNVEELLALTAHRVASDVTPPPAPDPARLGAHAVSLRRRRRMGAAAAATVATVVAAAIVVSALGDRPSDAEPVEPPTSPRLGNVPAWVDLEGDIHVGEHELDLPEPPARSEPLTGEGMPKFSVTERGVVWRDASEDAPLYWQAPNGEPVELTAHAPLFFTADPLGDLVVWVTMEHEMVTYDVAQHRVIDSRSVPAGDDWNSIGTTLPVLFVGDDRVVYETGEEVWTLDLAEGTTTRIPGMSASDLLDYGPAVSVVAVTELRDGVGGSRSLAQLAFRTATGTVQADPGRLFQEGRLSPDGRWFVTSTGYEAGLRTVVLDTSTGKQVPLDLPDRYRGPYPDPWGWAGADVLNVGLLRRNGDVEDRWMCRPALGTCDLLPRAAPYAYPW